MTCGACRAVVLLTVIAVTFPHCSDRSPSAPTPLPPPAGTAPPEPPATPVPTPEPRPSVAPRISRSRYLAFGDSLTAGTTSPAVVLRSLRAGPPQSYPFKLQELLSARYPAQEFEVRNEGLPGEAAANAVRRLSPVLREAAAEVVILLHGVNDITFLGMAGVPRVADHVNTMAREARMAGADVLICTLPPHREGGFRAADQTVIAAYNRALREVARGEGAVLIDFEREVDVRLIGQDGLHPTEEGYAHMAAVLSTILRQRFEALADAGYRPAR